MNSLAVESISNTNVSDMEIISDSFNNLKRFYIPTDKELDDVILYSKVVNTELSTQNWYKLFKQFRQVANFDGDIKDIANEKQLEMELCNFFVGVRKKDGDF